MNFTDYMQKKYGGGANSTTSNIPEIADTSLNSSSNSNSDFANYLSNKYGANNVSNTTPNVIKEYEAIPDYNILDRAFNSDKRDAYNKKQSLLNDYQTAKSVQNAQLLSKYGLTADDVTRKGPSSSAEDKRITNLLKSKGMTEDEINSVKSYGATNLQKKANENLVNFTDKNKVGGTLLSSVLKPVATVTGTITNTADYLSGRPLDNNSDANALTKTVNNMRDTASADLGNVGKFAYGVGTSMVDMIPTFMMGTGYAGASAMQDAMVNNIDRGLAPKNAYATSLASGIAEGLLEKLPLGKLESLAKGVGTGKGGKAFVKGILASMGSEAIEEGGTDIANTLADLIINKSNAEFVNEVNAYKAQGMNNEDSIKKALGNLAKTVGMDALAGGVSGGLMGTGAAGIGKVRNVINGTTDFKINNVDDPEFSAKIAEENRVRRERLAEVERAKVEQQERAVNRANMENRIAEEQRAYEQPDLTNLLEEANKIPNAETNPLIPLQSENVPTITEEVQKPKKKRATKKQKAEEALERVVASLYGEVPPSLDALEKDYQLAQDYYKDKYFDEFKKARAKKVSELDALEAEANATANVETPTNTTPIVAEPSTTTYTEPNPTTVTANPNPSSNPAPTPNVEPTITGNGTPKTEVAKDTTDNSILAKNTLTRSTLFSRAKEAAEYLDSSKKSGKFSVDSVSETESLNESQRRLAKDYDGEVERLLKSPDLTGVDVDETVAITADAVDEAVQTGDWSFVDILTTTFNNKIHNVAQALQALAKYTRTATGVITKTQALSKARTDKFVNKKSNADKVQKSQRLANALAKVEGTAKVAEAKVPKTFEQTRAEVIETLKNNKQFGNLANTEIDYLTRLVEKGASKDVIASKLNQKLATGSFGLNPEQMKQISDIFNQLEKMDKPNSKEAVELEKQAYEIAAEALGDKTFMEKWNAWRYLAMLGNPRTHIRNMIGNASFGAVTDIKDQVAARIEEAVARNSKNGIERTKAPLTPADADLVKACGDFFDSDVYAFATDDGGKFNLGNEIEQARKTFKSKSVEKVNQFNSDLLTKEDNSAIKRKFKKSLASYLKANGADANIFNSTNANDQALLQKGMKYAVEQAKIATFHEDNAVANVLSNWSRTAQQSGSVGGKALNAAMEALIPFKKTPANILKQGAIEYNPAYQLGHIIYEIVNKDSTTNIIDSGAKGITGAGLLALGILGAMSGSLRGGNDDDADELYGEQEYSINWGDGNSYTIDWMAPAALPIFMGVELYKAMENEGKGDGADILNALSNITEPIVELSMLEGLRNTIQTGAYALQYDKGSFLSSIAASIGTNYVSQGVPTIFGQITRATEENRKDTRAENTGALGTIEKSARKTANKIPGLTDINEDYVDVWGEKQKNVGNNFATRLAYNMLSPGYYSNTKKDNVETEIDNILKEIPDAKIIPSTPDQSYEKQRLTNKQYTDLSKAVGNNYQDMLGALVESRYYQSLDAEQKAEAMKGVISFAKAYGKYEVLDYNMGASSTYKKAFNTYRGSGLNALVNLYIEKARNADKD